MSKPSVSIKHLIMKYKLRTVSIFGSILSSSAGSYYCCVIYSILLCVIIMMIPIGLLMVAAEVVRGETATAQVL